MDELYIVYDDNYGSITDRIQFAFASKEKAEEYAKQQKNKRNK